MKLLNSSYPSSDPNDQELMDLLKQQRQQREAMLAPIQAAQGQPDLGGALAGIAGGFADVLGKGQTNYAGKAIGTEKAAADDALQTRLKALDEKDATLKPLVDLAKLRASERGLDKRQAASDSRQDKQLDAAYERANLLAGNKGASLDLRKDEQASRAAASFDKDPILSSLTKQQQQIARDKHTLDTATTLTPQLANEIQTGIATAIQGGHVAAQGTIHDLQYNSAEIEFTKLKQRLLNRPQDIGSPEVKKYFSDILERLGTAYTSNIADRANQIAVGRNYDHNPYAQTAVKQKLASYAPPAAAPAAPATGPHGPTVTQNGHTFTWNPATGAYE